MIQKVLTLKIVEEFAAQGHPNITATHTTTLEVTKELSLTKMGNCIVAVGATRGLNDLSEDFRKGCVNDKSRILVELRVSNMMERITGRGSHLLSLTDEKDLVIRKSTYVSNRTLMIKANKSASDLSRHFVQLLRSNSVEIHVRLTVCL
jgi:hypothetical protein